MGPRLPGGPPPDVGWLAAAGVTGSPCVWHEIDRNSSLIETETRGIIANNLRKALSRRLIYSTCKPESTLLISEYVNISLIPSLAMG